MINELNSVVCIQGHRAPYLQTGGDSMFEAFTQLGMKYDSTVGVESQFLDPPIWPYTLDYGVSSVYLFCFSKILLLHGPK